MPCAARPFELPRAVYEDESLVVLDKPAGLLAVPGRGPDKADCLLARAQAHWPGLRVAHRLDMGTSGLIVFARGIEAQRALSAAFEARKVDKRYVAVVSGVVPGPAGMVDAPLAADWPNRPRQQTDAMHGRPALTYWRCLAVDASLGRSRLELQPVTGRSHQLRVHLASIGHPIVGDALYAPPEVASAATRLLLHAARLAFAHPLQGTALAFESAVPF